MAFVNQNNYLYNFRRSDEIYSLIDLFNTNLQVKNTQWENKDEGWHKYLNPKLSSTTLYSGNTNYSDIFGGLLKSREELLAEDMDEKVLTNVAKRLEKLARLEKKDAFKNDMIGDDGINGSGITGGMWAAGTVGAVNFLDKATMGNKNFGALSAAIDSTVHMASSALMKSGNPYAMAAGAALEGANFLTKVGGQTVLGYDVDIKSSGYGDLGHKESSSSRDFGAMIGLGGLFNIKSTLDKLLRRNEEAAMALKAADIADTQKFEQEARSNSVDNTIRQNQVALAGGLDTSILAAKQGGSLQPIIVYMPVEYTKESILKALNGAKLQNIEVSDTPSVIPSGALHKNKHDDFDLEVTKKGIPVITVNNDNVETLEEIQLQSKSLVLHAEVEESEVILNKSLTDFVEEARKKWHASDKKNIDICKEVGMRLAKELMENTDDNTNLIKQLKRVA